MGRFGSEHGCIPNHIANNNAILNKTCAVRYTTQTEFIYVSYIICIAYIHIEICKSCPFDCVQCNSKINLMIARIAKFFLRYMRCVFSTKLYSHAQKFMQAKIIIGKLSSSWAGAGEPPHYILSFVPCRRRDLLAKKNISINNIYFFLLNKHMAVCKRVFSLRNSSTPYIYVYRYHKK